MSINVNELKVGEYVGFKCDIEQGSKILEVVHGPYGKQFKVRAFEGGYVDNINGTIMLVDARDCWID